MPVPSPRWPCAPAGRVDPQRLLFATDPASAQRFPAVLAEIRRLEDVRRTAALFRSHPRFATPADFAAEIRKLVNVPPGGS